MYRGYAEEKRRGGNTLYWEDVKVGEQIKLHNIGPYSQWDAAAVLTAMPGHALAFELEWERDNFILTGSLTGIGGGSTPGGEKQGAKKWVGLWLDPSINAYVCPAICHFVDEDIPNSKAYTGGIPVGFYSQLEWLLGRMICNWMGDDGFLKVLDNRVPIYPIIGDVFCCRGQVTKKYIEDDEYLVDLEVRCENLDGIILVAGSAKVQLPSRTDYKIKVPQAQNIKI